MGFFDYYKQILKQLHQVKTDLSKSTTNDRKVYYINEEISTLDSWSHLLFFIQIYIVFKMVKLYSIDYTNYGLLIGILCVFFIMTPIFYNFCVWLFGILSYIVYLKPFTYTHL